MKKRFTLMVGIAIVVALFTVHQGTRKFAMSYDGGAPSGYAGDPAGSNKNCTQCHGGTATSVSGWITSNIPVTGYVPSTVYQVTTTITGTGGNKGFSISPQSSTGAFLGTLAAGTGTGLNGTNHYIRSTGSNITTNPMTWTFTWTSPATGLGPVTFYGAFAIGTGITKTSTYTVSEASVGIAETSNKSAFTVYPNPVRDNVSIDYALKTNSKVTINVYSIDGRKIICLHDSEQTIGIHSEKISLKDLVSKGVYLIELKTDDTSAFEKIMIE